LRLERARTDAEQRDDCNGDQAQAFAYHGALPRAGVVT
jgi:hypothetical protein